MKTKVCSKCKKRKLLSKFHKCRKNKDGLHSWCHECYAAWRNVPAHRVRARKRAKEWKKANPDKVRSHNLRRYGVTVEQYEQMLKAQKGGCWVCGSTPKKRRLHVDHSHKSGKIRGLLCHRCNRGLAWFSDKSERLRRAAEYLEQNGLDVENILKKPCIVPSFEV